MDGSLFDVLLSYDKLKSVAARSRGQALEARDLVPFCLRYPTAIFEGLTRDADEPIGRGVGWRCYVTAPEKAYAKDGREVSPHGGEVFLVFLNAGHVAYNWYWDRCDPDDRRIPRGCVGETSRFNERLL